jgi:hypothetical protein
MSQLDSSFPHIDASNAEALPGLPSPSSPALYCAASKLFSQRDGTSQSLEYSPIDSSWKFTDRCPEGRRVVMRNAVAHDGELFEVRSVSPNALQRGGEMRAVWLSRNVARLGENCLAYCRALQFVAFEGGSHLGEIGSSAFHGCSSLQSVAIPSSVRLLAEHCFYACASLESVTFEPPSRLATIEEYAFWWCHSLNWLLLPASVTAINGSAFVCNGIRSIGIEEGSVSFRVVNELLVDFEVRSLVLVLGSPESIEIPSSIEEFRPCCCLGKGRLKTVDFESDSNLRLIDQLAFSCCQSLESICLPSSVEVIRERCFDCCSSLRTVTFGAESRLRLIEPGAFHFPRPPELVGIPAGVEVIHRPDVTFD